MTANLSIKNTDKSSVLGDVEKEFPNSHYILCAPTMPMKNLLVQIANSINVHVKGDR